MGRKFLGREPPRHVLYRALIFREFKIHNYPSS
jgi:hypothetical protein